MSKLEAKIVLTGVDKASTPLEKATKNIKAMAGQLTETRKRFAQLNDIQKNLSGFAELKNKLKGAGNDLKQARDKVNELSKALKSTTNPTKEMTASLEKAKTTAQKLKEQFSTLSEKTKKQHEELKKSGISARNLSSAQAELKQKMQATTESIDRQKAHLQKLNAIQKRSAEIKQKYKNGMMNAAVVGGVGYGSLATGRAISRGLTNALSVGYEFDASMSATQAVVRIEDKNDARMLALREQARTLPTQSKFTDSEVAEGQYFLARTGFTAEQVLKAMPAMLNLAAAGDLDLGTTADIASNIQTAMGIPAEEMGRVADVLTAAFTRNNVDIQMLGESLKYTAGIARAMGISFETITTATAMLGSAGIQGDKAGTSMRQIALRIGNSKQLKDLGIKTSDDNGNLRDLADILSDIHAATAKMGTVQKADVLQKISGQVGVTAFTELIELSADDFIETDERKKLDLNKFKAMRLSLENSQGEAEKVAATKLDNLKGDMTMFHAALENISVELFEKNNEWLRDAVKGLTKLLHGFGEFLKKNPAISKALVIIGAGLAAATVAFGAISLAIMSVLGPLVMMRFAFNTLGLSMGGMGTKGGLISKAFGLVGKSIRALFSPLKTLMTVIRAVGIAFLGNPIGLAVTAIAAAALLISPIVKLS